MDLGWWGLLGRKTDEPEIDRNSEAYRRGVEAAKLASIPELDARIAYLNSQLADPSITATERSLSRRECELLTQRRDAEAAEEARWRWVGGVRTPAW